MANAEHVAQLKQGGASWNAWRRANVDIDPDLSKADLFLYNLRDANLSRANLSGADLGGAILRGARFIGANLSKADLRDADLNRTVLVETSFVGADLSKANVSESNFNGADLRKARFIGANLSRVAFRDADLRDADLRDADLRDADLRDADLRDADLRDADLSGATIGGTIFSNVDLSQVVGLVEVQHRSPSSIGTDTLIRSQGKIPEVFLRGCGVPDSLIEYLPSLIGAMQPIQFYSCFISYSSADDAFAKRLHERLRAEHLRVWYAPEELKGGQKLRDQIDSAIRVYDKLLLIVSDASMVSKWVTHEVRKAYQQERINGKRILFPIRLNDFESLKQWTLPDDDTGEDLALELRRYYIPDFSTWKDHDAFEAAFTRLLVALRATETKA